MNRTEALNILGLDHDASASDVKTAYRECVQILHPDRFANNEKLQDRATEQFKRLQDAYDYLTSGKGSKGDSAPRGQARSSASSHSTLEAKLAGLTAARTQLIAQRDALVDARRNALIMMGAGAVGAIFGRRIVWIAGIAGTLFVWGIVSTVSAVQNLRTIDEHVAEIDMQKRQLEENWEEED